MQSRPIRRAEEAQAQSFGQEIQQIQPPRRIAAKNHIAERSQIKSILTGSMERTPLAAQSAQVSPDRGAVEAAREALADLVLTER